MQAKPLYEEPQKGKQANLKDQLRIQRMYNDQIKAQKTAMDLKNEELAQANKKLKQQKKIIEQAKQQGND